MFVFCRHPCVRSGHILASLPRGCDRPCHSLPTTPSPITVLANMRGDQLSRRWKLVRLLSGPRGRTLKQLVGELGVVKRTVQRDMDALEAGGFPITSEERNGTVFWRFMEGFRMDTPLSLDLPELMALYFSRGLLKPLEGSVVYEAIESAISKIGSAIPAQAHSFLREVDDGIAVSSFGWKDYSHSRDVIASLTKALYHHFTVEMKHAAAGKKAAIDRKVDPYKLWYANGGLYLVGWDYSRDEFLVFAIERIDSVRLTNKRFPVRPDFDFDKMRENAFQMIWGEAQEVRIRFAPCQAPYVKERTWHPSQEIIQQPDGSVLLKMEVSNLGEVRRWLIGWGADAEVLEPAELATEIAEHANRILHRQTETSQRG
jgi:predicted DNA-binding transcriptional regulator YafY